MEKLTINERFTLVCPEGFRTLTKKEYERLDTMADSECLFLTHDDSRIVVSMGWKDIGAVASFLLRLISPVKSVEASVNRSMSSYGYRLEEMLTRQIGGQPVQGFRYTYTAGGTPMVGESYVIRQDRSLTFFHGYMPQELRESALALWHGLLDAVQPL